MPSAITRTHKNRRSARRAMTVNRPQPTTPINMTNAVAAGAVITITFDPPVILRGTPKYSTDIAGADAISAVLTSPTTLALTFDAAVAAATVINIPYEEPGIRNSSGGFVSHNTFPV